MKKITDQSAKIYAVAPRARNAGPLFFGFIGAVFTGFGLLNGNGVTDLSVVMGVGFIAFAIYIYVYNKKAYAPQV